MSRMTWRKVKQPTGLSAIGWDGWDDRELWYENENIAMVQKTMHNNKIKYYWYSLTNNFSYNSYASGILYDTIESAMKACKTYMFSMKTKGML